MADLRSEAVRKWSELAVGDAFSIAGLGASLGMVEWTGSSFAFSAAATVELADITAIGILGIVGGGIALAALPIVAGGVVLALATRDDKTSEALIQGADAMAYTSAGTLLAVAVGAPILALTSSGESGDRLLPAKVIGPILDLGTGMAAATGLERVLAGGAGAAAADGWFHDTQSLYSQVSPAVASPSPSQYPSPTPGPTPSSPPSMVPGPSGGSSGSPLPDYGPGPTLDDLYPLMPGMGDLDSSFSKSTDNGSFSSPFTMTMTFSAPGGNGAETDNPNSGSNSNDQPTDCQDDCQGECPTAPTPTPGPPSDCSDCSHQCADCECDDCEC